jgi:general secretion pathway protein A
MYSTHYGFSEKPFELSPNPKFLFLTSGLQSTLETILNGIRDRKGWIVLSGEVGTGKTMLTYGVMDRLPQQVKAVFIFHSTYSYGELLGQILSELGEPVSKGGLENLRNHLIRYLEVRREKGETLAVLIDEAQKLSQEVVRELFGLLAWEPWVDKTLQLVLVGQPELDGIIDAALLKSRPPKSGLRIVIHPLSNKESYEYIEHRLRIVGSSSTVVFSADAMSLITEYARGIPRVINILCDNALLYGYNEGLKNVGINTAWKVLGDLEGPDFKRKIKFKIASETSAFRFPTQYGLIALGILFLGAGFWWFQERVSTRQTPSKSLGNIQAGAEKRDSARLSPGSSPAEKSQIPGPALGLTEPQKTDPEKLTIRETPRSAPPTARRIMVKRGNNLSSLSVQYYGKFNESLVDLISRYNPSIKDLDLIMVDQVIQLPVLAEETLLTSGPDGFGIILGTFRDQEQAGRFKVEPALKGKKVILEPRRGSRRGTWVRVEAGNYGSKEEALAALKTLRTKKLLPFFE